MLMCVLACVCWPLCVCERERLLQGMLLYTCENTESELITVCVSVYAVCVCVLQMIVTDSSICGLAPEHS